MKGCYHIALSLLLSLSVSFLQAQQPGSASEFLTQMTGSWELDPELSDYSQVPLKTTQFDVETRALATGNAVLAEIQSVRVRQGGETMEMKEAMLFSHDKEGNVYVTITATGEVVSPAQGTFEDGDIRFAVEAEELSNPRLERTSGVLSFDEAGRLHYLVTYFFKNGKSMSYEMVLKRK